jgi:hypothetical protein
MLASDRACTPLPPLDLHAKEGVDGSSPSEGSKEGQQMAFFVASDSAKRRTGGQQTVPKTRPQTHERAGVLAWTDRRKISEHLHAREKLHFVTAAHGVTNDPAQAAAVARPASGAALGSA